MHYRRLSTFAVLMILLSSLIIVSCDGGATIDYMIWGRVDVDGSGLGNTTIELENRDTGTVYELTTDYSGYYWFESEDYNAGYANYRLTPSKLGYSFEPEAVTFEVKRTNANQDFNYNFSAYYTTVNVSGVWNLSVSNGPNAKMTLFEDETVVITIDGEIHAEGNYTMQGQSIAVYANTPMEPEPIEALRYILKAAVPVDAVAMGGDGKIQQWWCEDNGCGLTGETDVTWEASRENE